MGKKNKEEPEVITRLKADYCAIKSKIKLQRWI